MFQIILQECKLINNKQTGFVILKKNIETYLKKYFEKKPCRLETTFPPFLVPIHDVLSLQFILFHATTKYWKSIGNIPETYWKTYPKKHFRLETALPAQI